MTHPHESFATPNETATPSETAPPNETAPPPVGTATQNATATQDRTGRRASRRRGGARRLRPHRAGRLLVATVAVLALIGAACSSPADDEGADGTVDVGSGISTPDQGTFPPGTTVRLLAHDSFNASEDVIDAFEGSTGIEVEVVRGGDAVAMVNQAILTAGDPQADALFGIDDNLLDRAEEAELFEPYEADGLDQVPDAFTEDLDATVTPIDYGDVCINYDRSWFAGNDVEVPETLEDLTDPAYRDLLVVQDPTSSSPGLSFLLASVAELGGEAWDWWQRLADNGVKVVDGWETAYYTDFSGSSGEGPRPLVVSYASSPPAEVADPSISPEESPTGVLPETCYRQVEYAGVLRGAAEPEAAEALIDFLLSVPFQNDVPEQMYVFPVNGDATLPETWERFVEPVDDPLQLPPSEVAANQEDWLQQWAGIFR